jgi:hypothetical protein
VLVSPGRRDVGEEVAARCLHPVEIFADHPDETVLLQRPPEETRTQVAISGFLPEPPGHDCGHGGARASAYTPANARIVSLPRCAQEATGHVDGGAMEGIPSLAISTPCPIPCTSSDATRSLTTAIEAARALTRTPAQK